MWFETAVIVCKNIVILVSQSTNGLIIAYEAKKQPLSKTILDGCIIDTCCFRILLFGISLFSTNLVFLYGQIHISFGQFFLFFVKLIFECMYASYQVTVLTKSVLVFVPSLIEDFSDKELRLMSRIFIVISTAFATIIDTISTPKPSMTGSDEYT